METAHQSVESRPLLSSIEVDEEDENGNIGKNKEPTICQEFCRFDGFTLALVYFTSVFGLGICAVFQNTITENPWDINFRNGLCIVLTSTSSLFLFIISLVVVLTPESIVHIDHIPAVKGILFQRSEDVLKFGLALLSVFVLLVVIFDIFPRFICMNEYKKYEAEFFFLFTNPSVILYDDAVFSITYYIFWVIFAACLVAFCWNCMHLKFYRIWYLQIGFIHVFVTLLIVWCDFQLTEAKFEESHVRECLNLVANITDAFAKKCMCRSTKEFNTCRNLGEFIFPGNVEFCLLASERLLHIYCQMVSTKKEKNTTKYVKAIYSFHIQEYINDIIRSQKSILPESKTPAPDTTLVDSVHQTKQLDISIRNRLNSVDKDVDQEVVPIVNDGHVDHLGKIPYREEQEYADVNEYTNGEPMPSKIQASASLDGDITSNSSDQSGITAAKVCTNASQDSTSTSPSSGSTPVPTPSNDSGIVASCANSLPKLQTSISQTYLGQKWIIISFLLTLPLGIIYICLYGLKAYDAYNTKNDTKPVVEWKRNINTVFYVYVHLFWTISIVITLLGIFSLTHRLRFCYDKNYSFSGFAIFLWLSPVGYYVYAVFSIMAMVGYKAGTDRNCTKEENEECYHMVLNITQTILDGFQIFLQIVFISNLQRVIDTVLKLSDENKIQQQIFYPHYTLMKHAIFFLFFMNVFIWGSDSFIDRKRVGELGKVQAGYFINDIWSIIIDLTYPLILFFRFNCALQLLSNYFLISSF